jgi:hypothetical protein
MALTKYPTTIQVDSSPREQSRNVPPIPTASLPVIELWYGDITASGAISNEDILVLSSAPSATLIGNSAISAWGNTLLGPVKIKWLGLNPNFNAEAYNTVSGSPVADILFWDPVFGPLSAAQAAPYKTDDIFRGAQAMWGHIPKSIIIPIHIGNNGFCDSTIMLQSVLHSALKMGGWHKYIPSKIKIILDASDTNAFNAFDTIADNYDTLRGAHGKAAGTNPPSSFPLGYSSAVAQSNSWMKNMFASVQGLNPITEFQAFAINIYTTGFFTQMQTALRTQLSTDAIYPLKGSGIPLPNYYGIGYTDLGNKDYQTIIPLLAVFSAGLSNIPAYQGTTFRGDSGWNSFTPGTSIRIIDYMSSADEFYGISLPWPATRFRDEYGQSVIESTTSPPWDNSFHIRTQSLTAKDISPYSAHQYEREHVYDHEFIEFVASNEQGGLKSPGGYAPKRNISTAQIPDSISPLLK